MAQADDFRQPSMQASDRLPVTRGTISAFSRVEERSRMSVSKSKVPISAALAAVLTVALAAQTQVTAPKNKYSPADDVKLGQDAAQQVQQEMPVMRDEEVNSYLNSIGHRLAESIPQEFQHPEFRYTFTGVNLREINAFALPGGPMFVNRGMMEKAHNEGEVAGVMAHELSHVALRHGTAQATKATPYEIGTIAGAVLGAIVGGTAGSVISQGTQFGLGTAFLRYSRDYEKQADILGTHIMARAGYDPRDMANVFKTIEKESGPGGPQWMSDHPNPGNRYEYITREAQALHVASAPHDTRGFQDVQAHLRTLAPAPSAEEAARNAKRNPNTGGRTGTTGARPTPNRVDRPDSRFSSYTEGNLFRVSVPANWRELAGNNDVTFAPEGAYGDANGQSVFTHGTQIGLARNETHDLATATDELLQQLGQGNPQLQRASNTVRGSLGGQEALRTSLTNVSEVTGTEERIDLYTSLMRDGTLFYVIGVAPAAEYNQYSPVFSKVVRSIQFTR
jgi:predicted Zn-dependent protease